MRYSRFGIATVSIWLFGSYLVARAEAQRDPVSLLVPKPVRVVRSDGFCRVSQSTTVGHGRGASVAAALLKDSIREITSGALPGENGRRAPGVVVRLNRSLSDKGPESYRLTVRPDGVTLEAPDPRGLANGVHTVCQLLLASQQAEGRQEATEWRLPCLTIEDHPRFPWRGLMLDCSRTFQSPDYIRRTLDRMSLYKLNVLHLHLTDDQGWRLAIRKYPPLTAKGARFPGKYAEPAAHEGFYSQAEMRGLISYAAARNVAIVPEIEMPGHALAALSCFPELACSGGPFEIYPFFKGPNITKDIFCAGNDRTFEFIGGVLAEVAALFPSEFVHVGGDEAPKDAWRNCPKCRARIQSEGLKDEHELQRWFMQRVERTLRKHGKRLIGWDEILEGGLAPGAAVMSWRGTSGGIAAANAGHDVVMAPTSHCYFDYTYEKIDSKRAYSFEPVPAELPAERVRHVFGLQANFWSHIDREPEKVDYQLFPRLLAIAERGWSPKDAVDWTDFSRRLRHQLVHLERFGIRYNLGDIPVETPAPVSPER